MTLLYHRRSFNVALNSAMNDLLSLDHFSYYQSNKRILWYINKEVVMWLEILSLNTVWNRCDIYLAMTCFRKIHSVYKWEGPGEHIITMWLWKCSWISYCMNHTSICHSIIKYKWQLLCWSFLFPTSRWFTLPFFIIYNGNVKM